MIVVDSSALVAILFGEVDAESYSDVLAASDRAAISAANLVETLIVFDRRTKGARTDVIDDFLASLELEIVPVSMNHVQLARAAHLRFGQAFHDAALNFGNCFAYALAKERGLPLLFKGNDFSQTDIEPALTQNPKP